MDDSLIARRNRLLGLNVPTFYERPLHLVRGEGVWLWDADGRRYLDCYNNVPHVGHCHPRVVEAIARQAATLNTHTRYLHAGIIDYVEALTARFGHGLSQAILMNSGSEANDVALRIAQAATGKIGIVATDDTYHGNTALVSQLSSRRPPIGGYPGHVRLVPAPDSVNPVGGSLNGQAEAFARNVHMAIVELEDAGFGFAGFILCPAFANEGMPRVDKGFLDPAVGVIRRSRGLIVADEVQPGFGRLGSHWWGHERLGFVPDIVTLGKPMANGHPVAAVLTRPDLMTEFRDAYGYFSTFGGNPVSMAAAQATLDVIVEEKLVDNARIVGTYTLEMLRRLRHPRIVEVRGMGLFLAVELDNGAVAGRIVEAMKDRGVLIGRVGRQGQVLKIRPPMPFSQANADEAVGALAAALADITA